MAAFVVGSGARLGAARRQRPVASQPRWLMSYNVLSKEKVEDVFGGDGGQKSVAKYRFDIEVEGQKTREIFREIHADFKRNASFPGFRKGQIPPFMQKEMQRFALEEVLSTSLASALEQNKLKPCEGDAAVPEYSPSIKDLKSAFTVGEPLQFKVEIACVTSDDSADSEADPASAALENSDSPPAASESADSTPPAAESADLAASTTENAS